jgi:GGDEF domain-containing protein
LPIWLIVNEREWNLLAMIPEEEALACCTKPDTSVDIAPHLREISAYLFDSREKIVDQWVGRESTAEMLEKLAIEKDHFIHTYAIPVVEYFIGVVEGTKSVGDCPIMQKFIAFLTDKGITARDIFILCMALRRSLIGHLFAGDRISTAEAPVILEEISDVFDGNLSGVLQTFTELTMEKERDLQQQIQINRQNREIQTILNLQNNLVCVVEKNSIVMANQTFLERVGVKDLDTLHSRYPREWGFIKSVNYLQKLFRNKAYDAWFDMILSHPNHPVIKVSIQNQQTQRYNIYVLQMSRFPEQPGKYILSMTDITSYEKQIRKLSEQAYTDAVTGAYNRLKFDITLPKILTKKEGALFLIEIDNFYLLQKNYDEKLVEELLHKIAQSMLQILPKAVHLYRVDTGTFALLPTTAKIPDHEAFATGITSHISGLQTHISEAISCSIGILTIRDSDTKEILQTRFHELLELLRFSDQNSLHYDDTLYEAQQQRKREAQEIQKVLYDLSLEPHMIDAVTSYKEIPIKRELKIAQIAEDSVNLV